MNVAAYARYSTDRQTENSIATQLDTIIKYCQTNNHTIAATYIDEARSGTNTDRDGFRRLVDGARIHAFDGVVIYDISRGSRDVADWFNFRKEMRDLHISVICATESLGDISNPNDFLVELINVGLGQHMVLQTRQKSIAGVATKAKDAVFLGGTVPLGYDVDKDGNYIINPIEAPIVRMIFDEYAAGGSYNDIIDIAAAKGWRGKRGQPIGKNSLHAILKNERYIGVYTWNKRRMKYMGKWAGGGANPNEVRIEGAIPPIIDSDTWRKVEKRMNDNKHNAANTAKETYLLSGLIECGECGGKFTGKTNTSGKGYRTRYYVCNNKYRTHTCHAKNINADEIEAAVTLQLRHYLLTTDFGIIADAVLSEYNSAQGNRDANQTELTELKRQLGNLLKALANGFDDIPEVHDEITSLRLRIAGLSNAVAMHSGITVTREDIIEQLKKDTASITDDDMPRLIKAYVTKIYAHSNEIVITGGVNMDGCGGTKYILFTIPFPLMLKKI